MSQSSCWHANTLTSNTPTQCGSALKSHQRTKLQEFVKRKYLHKNIGNLIIGWDVVKDDVPILHLNVSEMVVNTNVFHPGMKGQVGGKADSYPVITWLWTLWPIHLNWCRVLNPTDDWHKMLLSLVYSKNFNLTNPRTGDHGCSWHLEGEKWYILRSEHQLLEMEPVSMLS